MPAAEKEIAMLNLIESTAGRIVTQIHSIGASFDPEVLSLPGGSLIALGLMAYSGIVRSMHREAPRREAPRREAPPREVPPREPPVAAAPSRCCLAK
jgi:hypothetical protein